MNRLGGIWQQEDKQVQEDKLAREVKQVQEDK